MSRLYRKKKLSKSSLRLFEYVGDISEEVVTKIGVNPSLREVQDVVRRYGVRGSDVELLVREVIISLKSLRINGSGG